MGEPVMVRSRGGPNGKYYAVALGQVLDIYRSWLEASRQVSEYIGNMHQHFNSLEEAEFYMNQHLHM